MAVITCCDILNMLIMTHAFTIPFLHGFSCQYQDNNNSLTVYIYTSMELEKCVLIERVLPLYMYKDYTCTFAHATLVHN